jgi:hypothetical protein
LLPGAPALTPDDADVYYESHGHDCQTPAAAVGGESRAYRAAHLLLAPHAMLPRHFRLLICLALTGCCAGPDYLTFSLVRHSGPSLEYTGSTAPRWGQLETMKSTDSIEILFPTEASLGADVLELYDQASTRVAFIGTDRLVPTDADGCEHNERVYLLDMLAPRQHTLVHRRKNGTGDPLNCDEPHCPWTSYDGDEAVTLSLVLE